MLYRVDPLCYCIKFEFFLNRVHKLKERKIMSNTNKPVKPLGDITPYVFDRTGELPANKVIERRTLTNENRTDFNHIIPYSAPFYSESVVVKHVATQETLVAGRDYYVVGSFLAGIVNNINFKPVAYAIIFDNPTVTGEFEITYQTMGGDASLDTRHYVELIANHMENPRVTDWESIIGRPVVFPPEPHPLHIGDTVGWNTVENRMEDIANAILALKRDESQANPSYAQLITEMFRFNDRMDKTDEEFERFRQTQIRSMSGQIGDLIQQLQDIDAAYKRADTGLDTKFVQLNNNTVQTLTNTINQKESALSGRINNVNTTLTEKIATDIASALRPVNSNIAALQEADRTNRTELVNLITTKVQEEVTARETAIRDARAYTDTKHQQAATLVTQSEARSTTAINNAKQELNTSIGTTNTALGVERGRIDGILNRLNAADANNEFVKRTGNQTITGVKTFNGTVRVGHATTAANQSILSQTDNGFNIQVNGGTEGNKHFLLKHDGTLQYNNKRILNTDDYTTIDTKVQQVSQNVTNTLTPKITANEQAIAAIKTRIDAATEFVKMTGNQSVDGQKTFKQPLRVEMVGNTAKIIQLSRTATETIIAHRETNNVGKEFKLNDAGEVWYNNKRLLNIDDLTSPVNRITALETFKHTYDQANPVLIQRVTNLEGRLNGAEFVKKAGDTMTGPLKLKSGNFTTASADHFNMSGFNRINTRTFGTRSMLPMIVNVSHPDSATAAYSRGIMFEYGDSTGNSGNDAFKLGTYAFNADGAYIGMKEILTELHYSNINRKSDTLLQATTTSATGWVGLRMDNKGTGKYTVLEIEPTTNAFTVKGRAIDTPSVNDWYFRIPTNPRSKTLDHYPLMAYGTKVVGQGMWLHQKTSHAPFFAAYNGFDTDELLTTPTTGSVAYPLAKLRLNRGSTAHQTTMTLGYLSDPITSNANNGRAFLLFQQSTETANTVKGDHSSAFFFGQDGWFESTNGGFIIQKANTGDVVIYNNNDTTRPYLLIKSNGDLNGKKGRVHQNRAYEWVEAENPSTATTNFYSGYRSYFPDKKFRSEWVTNSDGTMRAFVAAESGSAVTGFDILFPKKSGTVALTSDIEALRTASDGKFVTLSTNQTITGVKTFSSNVSAPAYKSTGGGSTAWFSSISNGEAEIKSVRGNLETQLRLNANSATNKYIWSSARNITLTSDRSFEFFFGRESDTPDNVLIHNRNSAGNSHIRLFDNGTFGFYSNSHSKIIVGHGDSWLQHDDVGGQKVVSFRFIAFDNAYNRSDRRVKENINKITDALSTLTKLNGYTFNLKDGGASSAGLIAQEVQEVLPDLVAEDKEKNLLSLNYNAFSGYYVEALKEAHDRIVKLESRLEKIEALLSKR